MCSLRFVTKVDIAISSCCIYLIIILYSYIIARAHTNTHNRSPFRMQCNAIQCIIEARKCMLRSTLFRTCQFLIIILHFGLLTIAPLILFPWICYYYIFLFAYIRIALTTLRLFSALHFKCVIMYLCRPVCTNIRLSEMCIIVSTVSELASWTFVCIGSTAIYKYTIFKHCTLVCCVYFY